jgi:hypothetical protein
LIFAVAAVLKQLFSCFVSLKVNIFTVVLKCDS